MLSDKDLQILLDTAVSAAKAAGAHIQSQFDQHYDQGQKEGGDSLASQVVTEVDIKAQEIILGQLEESISKYDLGLLTEESADDQSRLQKDYFWCIDPMDGTLAFTEGRTGYAVSIALVAKTGNPLIGVVYVPDLKECYTSIKGLGVFLNDKEFTRKEIKADGNLHFYMDQSLQKEDYYDAVKEELKEWAAARNLVLEEHLGFGAVRNVIGAMRSFIACYFKFPKEQEGGGSIWDYAATRLFCEELKIAVGTSYGENLHLNNPENTFMNNTGILYATKLELAQMIKTLYMNRSQPNCG